MRKTLLTGAALILFAGSAFAQGVGGAIVDGFMAAQDADLQRQALERRARTGAAQADYDALVIEQRLNQIRRELQEQNRLLRDRDYYRPLRPW